METQRLEKQPGLVKMHKIATVLMWISWALFFVAMLGTYNFFLVGETTTPCDTVYYSSGGSGVPSQFLIV